MKIIEPGHTYQFHTLDKASDTQDSHIRFVNREAGHEHPGTQTQELLRALIDRTMHCDNCIPWDENMKIIHHMRMAIAYHEARALERKAEKGLYLPENVAIDTDGHFKLSFKIMETDAAEYYRRRK